MTDEVCPPLGTGSVDFNAIHEAAKNGKPLAEAIAKATTGGPPLAEPPTLADRSLDDLRTIAEDEGIETAGLRSKAALTEAIETNRRPEEPAPPPAETIPVFDPADPADEG